MEAILRPVPDNVLKILPRRDLLTLVRGYQDLLSQLESQVSTLEEWKLQIEEVFVLLKMRIFGPRSEKSEPENKENPEEKPEEKKDPKQKGKTRRVTKLPSERYPNLGVREETIELAEFPDCTKCGSKMIGSNMVDVSEYLTVIPRQYLINERRKTT